MTQAPPTLPPDIPNPFEWLKQRWLQVLGVLLLLIGLGLLLHHSIENGWLTPPLRVGFGVVLGLTLGGVGLKVTPRNRILGHVMMGGANASLYLSAWSAYVLFELIPGPVAFAALMGVTFATFVASARHEGQGLACMATLGGFLAPVLVGGSTWGPPYDEIVLTVYLCVITAGATALMLIRRWSGLTYLVMACAWIFMMGMVFDADTNQTRVVAQCGIAFNWLCLCVVPVARQFMGGSTKGEVTAAVLTVFSTMLAALLTCVVWYAPGGVLWSILGVTCAVLYGGAAVLFLREGHSVGLVHVLVGIALVFVNLSMIHLVQGPLLWSLLALEAVALVVPKMFNPTKECAKREIIDPFSRIGHGLMCMVFFAAAAVLFGETEPGFDAGTVQLVATCLATLVFAWVPRADDLEEVRPIFEWMAYLLALVSWLHQLHSFPHGDLLVTAGWGAIGVALIARGTLANELHHRWMGVFGVVLAAGKLLFVDLHGVDTIWRIVVFMALGVALLVLSYLTPDESSVVESVDADGVV